MPILCCCLDSCTMALVLVMFFPPLFDGVYERFARFINKFLVGEGLPAILLSNVVAETLLTD